MKTRNDLAQSRRWVIKIGSSLLTNNGRGLDDAAIGAWVAQIARLRDAGIEIVLVSSGAVAAGMSRLKWQRRPHALYALQAAAAVGQMGLIQAYESHFRHYDLHTAQILLTHGDLVDRQRYLNARSTLRALLSLGVVPVVNENDTVTTEEIRFGDNDNLAAMVANLVEADVLVILTDQEGLYTEDPRKNTDASIVRQALVGDPALKEMAATGIGTLGSGGMLTKIIAAERAAKSGAATVIAPGAQAQVLERIWQGLEVGTLLIPKSEPLGARKQWLASHLQVKGRLVLDPGAVRVLCESGSSLLSIGVTRVEGHFLRGEMVACLNGAGVEIARGLVNYSAQESEKIIGQASEKIEQILGYVDEPELIHRDNLVLT